MKRSCLAASAASLVLSVALAIAPLSMASAATSSEREAFSSMHVEHLVSDSLYSIPKSANGRADAGIATLADVDLPAQYDLRDFDLSTSVKYQNMFDTCWAFASIASFESALIGQGRGDADNTDLSEMQLAYFADWVADEYEAEKLGASGQAGEGIEFSGNSLLLGNNQMGAASIISRGTGVVAEEAAPYSGRERNLLNEEFQDWQGNTHLSNEWDPDDDWSLDKELATISEYQLDSMGYQVVYPIRSGNEWISNQVYVPELKKALMEHGAIALSYCVIVPGTENDNFTDAYTNTDTGARFVNTDNYSNHMATVVGWDDEYSKSNFLTEPPGDGAWIVKNSYGSVDSSEGNVFPWGINGEGYFYLSYYDSTIEDFSWLEPVESSKETSLIYQYDLLGSTSGSTIGFLFEEKAKTANVFTATEDMELTSVSATSYYQGTKADVSIYLLTEESTNPEDGRLLATATKDLGDLYYSRIYLDEPLNIKEGEIFSVVEEIYYEDLVGSDDPYNKPWTAAIEFGPADPSPDPYGRTISVICNPGESYIYTEGSWDDCTVLQDAEDLAADNIKTGNPMIKAFANPKDLSEFFRDPVIDEDDGSGSGPGSGSVDIGGAQPDDGNNLGSGLPGTGSGDGSGSGTGGGSSSAIYTGGQNGSSSGGQSGSVVPSGQASQGSGNSSVSSDPVGKLAQTGDDLPWPLIAVSIFSALASAFFLAAGIRERRKS